MRQPMRRRLLTAVMAAGLIGVNGAEHPVSVGSTWCSTAAARTGRSGRRDRCLRRRRLRLRLGRLRPARRCRRPRRRSFRGCSPSRWRFPPGTPEGQNPTPFVGEPPFLPPSFNPTNGSIVGAAKPIYINFQRPIANQQMAQDAVHITSVPPVPGRFYWTSDTQLRWRPQDFWPAGTKVYIDAAGTKSSFTVPEQLVATIDDATHEMQVMRNGELEKTIPVSMGMAGGGHTTPNGTYYVLEKFPHIVMDSSTYGVPVNSANGYKTDVDLAVRIDNSGNFVHSAPWSVDDQGVRNVSHGCINISPANAKWFYDNFGSGDPIVVKNSQGWYNQPDGASDWQMF